MSDERPVAGTERRVARCRACGSHADAGCRVVSPADERRVRRLERQTVEREDLADGAARAATVAVFVEHF